MAPILDCVVCGEICVDLPVRSIDQHSPLSQLGLVRIDPVVPAGGGIVANSGLAMARLGIRTAALGCIGDDLWGDVLVKLLEEHGVDTEYLVRLANSSTSATAVLVGETGEHTFAYHGGASQELTRQKILANLPLFERSQFALFGYYGLLADLESDLPEVLSRIQETGCKTALDAAGDGGTLGPLDRILPYLDIYFPSYAEAKAQTGRDDPVEMLAIFREFCPEGLLGIKLGKDGAILTLPDRGVLRVPAISAPGPVIDTTGAGDCFFAGLITGLVRDLEVGSACKLAAAAGACSVTGIGAVASLRDFLETCRLAGIDQ